ncbi:membrane protein insertase YidC [Agreia sp. COWG]|uniref:YidC/Oxa1 family membrane protein insertase n=1 Tax=Agreia sp. COWG TaxID=2773266 RepID=UPI001925A21C|nr:membrane protein insertase YidC [Agreia sp. COWG]CAD5995884.1 conserved membrane protein of unknown function [Agreia sp. COWG]
MNFFTLAPVAAALDAAYAVIESLTSLFEPYFPVAAAAVAIVIVTVLVRALLVPVGVSQARAEATRRRLAPEVGRLRTTHARNPERLQRELMALYSREKASPFAGFLPMLMQLPVVSLVYGLFTQQRINGHANSLLEHTVFDVPLGTSMLSSLGAAPGPGEMAVFGVILVLIAVVATLSRRYLAPLPPPQPVVSPTVAAPQAGAAGPGTEALGRILSFLPYLTVFFAASVPLAAAIYLAVSTTWSFVERLMLRRRMAQ